MSQKTDADLNIQADAISDAVADNSITPEIVGQMFKDVIDSKTNNTVVTGLLPFFNISNYGAVIDGTTDDRDAVVDAIAACEAAGGGVLWFPAGTCYISSPITITHSIRISGVGPAGALTNQYSPLEKDKFGPINFSSRIRFADNQDGFIFDKDVDGKKPHVIIENLYFIQNDTGANTSGSMIKVQGMNQDFIIQACTFYGGYVQLEVVSAYHYHVNLCSFSAPKRACIKTGNTVRTDTGDMSISMSVFSSGVFSTGSGDTGTVGIWWYAGGGMKLLGNKFDACSFDASHMFVYNVYCNNTLDPTSDILIIGNSLENWKVTSIKMVGTVSPYVRNIHIVANQFAATGSTGSCIDIENMRDMIISDFTIRDWLGNDSQEGSGSNIAAPAIRVVNCQYVTIGQGQIKDYTSNLLTTGTTNIDIHWKWAPNGGSGKVWAWPGEWVTASTEPAQTYEDTFTRADSALTMGNLEEPSSLAWVPVVGVWGIASNKAYCASASTSGGAVSSIVVTDVTLSDYTYELDITQASGGISNTDLIFRYSDSNNYYILDIALNAGTLYIGIYKKVAGGSFVAVGTAITQGSAVAGTHTYKIITSGNNITAYQDNVAIITTSDSFNSTATQVGILVASGSGSVGSADRFDNFNLVP